MLIKALKNVYQKTTYLLLAMVVSIVTFSFAVWLPNIKLIVSIITSGDVSLVSKIKLPLSLLGSITTNFTLFSATYTVLIAILFGVYVSLMTYFLRRRIKEVGQSGVATGFIGIMSGILGVGCAACGSFLLTSLLSIIGFAGAVALLPFDGSEFGVIGVLLLTYAIYITEKKITDPLVCKI